MARVRLAQRVPLRLRQAVVRSVPPQAWEAISPVVHGEAAWQKELGRKAARLATRSEARRWPGADDVAVRWRGRFYRARVVTCFTADDALDGNLAAVLRSLSRADVPHWLVSAVAGERRVLGVPASRRADAVAALRRSTDVSQGYVGIVVGDAVKRTRPAPACTEEEHPVLRFFDVLATRSGQVMAGPAFGCDIEFWSETDGALVAPRPNRYAAELPPEQQRSAMRDVNGTLVPSFPPFCVPHVFDVGFPIDVVYTWVDGSDPAWIQRKAQAWEQVAPGSVNDLAANSSRYLSRDELRYSLRSLDMYAPWVRKVFIVTDDQVPPWLDTDHHKVCVISHREIFGDTGRLPTFNSHAIESRLHRIPGLAEHYLYMNDDVFFGRPVSPELFFNGNGTSRFFLSRAHVGLGPSTAGDLPVMSAGKNNRELIRRSFDRVLTNKLKHVPHPQQRSLLAKMELEYAEDFARTAASQFRHPGDISIPSALFPYYAWMAGRASPADIRYYYADIAAPETSSRLRRLLRDRDYDVFCLNDHDIDHVDHHEQLQLILDFLERYFPLPGSFER